MSKPVKATELIKSCYDAQRRTCIQVERESGVVKYIPLDLEAGLHVRELPEESFDAEFTLNDDYPAAKACKLFVDYGLRMGVTHEALKYLGLIINITGKEIDMATAKQTKKPTAKPAAKKAPAKTAVKKPTTKKGTGEGPAKRDSAAQMFKDLIMAGNLTDDKIFERVQAKFGLDDKKRNYVSWYRSNLTKKGENPPPARGAK